ncbi:MAG: O-antigen ligase family protein [Cytophagaceae bacterium]
MRTSSSLVFKDIIIPLLVFLLGLGIAFVTNSWYFCLLPLILYVGIISIAHPRILFYLLFSTLPISITVFIGGSSLELPDEGIAIILTSIAPILLFVYGKDKFPVFLQPLFIIVLLSIIWIILLLFTTTNLALSVKYLIAKLWFTVPMILLTPLFISKEQHLISVLKILTYATALVVTPILIRYALWGFHFSQASAVVDPFFLNHVAISAFTATILPFIIYYYKKSTPGIDKLTALYTILICLIAGISSYTRITWLALIAIPFLYFVFKSSWFSKIIYTGIVLCGLSVVYILENNRYLDYAPNLEHVIFHDGDIEKHLEATMDFEDISGVERLYRWIAAKNSIAQHWIFGTGPNTFYQEYKKYTERAYSTYVSDNPEKSTTHNQFLLVFFEQGIIGFILFAGLCIYLLIDSHRLYHTTTFAPMKDILLMLNIALWMIIIHISVNDLIETDEIGFIFYFIIGLLLWCRYHIKNKTEATIIES